MHPSTTDRLGRTAPHGILTPVNSAVFHHALGAQVQIACSLECGEVVARSESTTGEPQYLLRYRGADGLAREAWWTQSALRAITQPGKQATAGPTEAPVRPATPGLLLNLPAIGTYVRDWGGIFAGILAGQVGKAGNAPDHILILSESAPDAPLSWDAARSWASAVADGNHADWSLPTRAESALLFANLKGCLQSIYHWTSEEYGNGSGAWVQDFDYGYQGKYVKSYEARARAVRRLVLQSFHAS